MICEMVPVYFPVLQLIQQLLLLQLLFTTQLSAVPQKLYHQVKSYRRAIHENSLISLIKLMSPGKSCLQLTTLNRAER